MTTESITPHASPYYQDETVTLHHGDSLEIARTLETGSIDCIVTSPPYYGLRDYGTGGQYGLEGTPAAYVETLRALFNELRRALADDGTLWLNLGDSYQSTGGMEGVGANAKVGSTLRQAKGRTRPKSGLPSKNLIGIPWRVAFALQDDGWILRNEIIWHKPNGMPQSVTDRLGNKHEHLFMFSKKPRYHFDLNQIRETAVDQDTYASGKNPGDVWSINTKPFPGAHFAVFPPELARRAVVAGCKPDGTVLDPFSGSGTSGLVATSNGRRYVGIDISADYLKLSLETRLRDTALDGIGA